jgi:hypothetical protein
MFPIGRPCGRPELRLRATRRAVRALRLSCFAFALAGVDAAVAQADLNLGFETLSQDGLPAGWSVGAGSADLATDALSAEGERSLKITRAAPGVTRVTRRLAAAALRPSGDSTGPLRLRLTGLARTSEPSASAALWLRIDGPRGPLFLDSGGYALEPVAAPAAASVAVSDGAAEWRRFAVEVPLPLDADEIALGVSLRGQGTVRFDALDLRAVATGALPPAAPVAVRYVDAALALMREHALRRGEVDWPAVRAQALEHARGATTAADAHVAVRFALRELGDRHSYLQSAAATRTLSTTAVANARTGSPLTAPHGRRLGENIAYLNVPGFAGGTPLQQVEFAEALKNAIQTNDGPGVCGWVVDLRQNTGGNLWPMLAGVGPLLGEGELAASIYPDGRRVAVWHRQGQAGFGDFTQLRVRSAYSVDASVPVAVLLGPATASSAEVLAVAFRGRAGARSFGAPTRGLSAGNRTFALADGASLVLTVAATSDAAGRVYAGPIAPDEPVARGAEPGGSEPPSDTALEAATSWLRAGDVCR